MVYESGRFAQVFVVWEPERGATQVWWVREGEVWHCFVADIETTDHTMLGIVMRAAKSLLGPATRLCARLTRPRARPREERECLVHWRQSGWTAGSAHPHHFLKYPVYVFETVVPHMSMPSSCSNSMYKYATMIQRLCSPTYVFRRLLDLLASNASSLLSWTRCKKSTFSR